MLTGSKNGFKVKQIVPDGKDTMLHHRGPHSWGREMTGLRSLPGECVLQRAVLVRKKLSAREGGGWLAGTLFCTHFRVAFVPQDGQKCDDNAELALLGDHDVALASIEKVVAVGPSRTKLVTPSSTLKFIPEELVLYCRDFRVLCFLFDRLTPEAQAVEITCAIARAYQPMRSGATLSYQKATMGSVEMKQFLSNRQRVSDMNWFESATDWEAELERLGATGWRVSGINDRFEMSTSLPRFNVVPQKVLDTELKKTFAHFNEGRIPRWCWRHGSGSDLLRMATFQNNIYHEKDDIRNLEALLFGKQRLCVVVELVDEMPTLADIQLAHSRLLALCLGDISTPVSVPDDRWLSSLEGTHWLDHVRCCLRKATEVVCLLREGHQTVILQESDDRDLNCVMTSLVQVMCDPHCRTLPGFQGLVQKEWVTAGHRFLSRANYQRDRDKEEAPLFLLFLDCVWQLWAQYTSHFQFTDKYLLALRDSIHLPLFNSFLSNSERERARGRNHLSQCYTQENGWREGLSRHFPHSAMDPPLPPVWDWALLYGLERRASFTQPQIQRGSAPPVLNGNLDIGKTSDSAPGLVFLLSRGYISSPSNLLPWRSGGAVGSAWRAHRRVPSSESWPSLERLLKAKSSIEGSRAPSNHQDPHEPLMPLLLGPCIGLWRDCYLRGVLQAQAFCLPTPTSYHPVDQLAREVQQLKEKLVLASSASSAKEQKSSRADANLNWSTNSNAVLFSAP